MPVPVQLGERLWAVPGAIHIQPLRGLKQKIKMN